MLHQPGLDFSFSGLKTAVALAVSARGPRPWPDRFVADIAASFQAAVVDTLVGKSMRAVTEVGARSLLLGGGVACNRELRRRLEEACAARGLPLRIPSPRLCADNGAMVALLGAWSLARGAAVDPDLDAVASLEASGLPLPRD
jgi:N6-L-threonylcarbamoyladenine synthase